MLCSTPGSLTITATATDNSNFSGTVVCSGLPGSLTGSRCGNGQLDPGEQCDTGSDVGTFGNCCTFGCQYASSSTTCRNAFNCDPAELCTGSSETCPSDVKDPDGSPCNDNDLCSTGKTCTAGICTNGTPLPAGTTCADPIPPCIDFKCDGAGTCDVVYNTDPCDDGDACTTNDACGFGFCTGGVPPDCGACKTCDSSFGCMPAIEPACDTPTDASALLTLDEGATPGNARLKWKWKNGPLIDVRDFGDPRTTTTYNLCVYDQNPLSPSGLRLMVEATAATGAAVWSPTSKGYKYRDATLSPDGLERIILKSGAAGKGQITLRARGANLNPANLPAIPPVTVQLKASSGACWGANYASPDKNTPIKLGGEGGP